MASHLARDGVGLAGLIPPVALPHRDDGDLGQDDGPTDGSGYLLGTLNTQIDMAIIVPDDDKCLEPGPLANVGLFLHWHNLQNFLFEGCSQEKVSDLKFLDGRGE